MLVFTFDFLFFVCNHLIFSFQLACFIFAWVYINKNNIYIVLILKDLRNTVGKDEGKTNFQELNSGVDLPRLL